MIDRSFIEKIEEMAPVEVKEIHGRQYTDSSVQLILRDPHIEKIEVTSLQGFISAVELIEPSLRAYISIHNPGVVSLFGPYNEEDGRRDVLIQATAIQCEFNFATWYSQEEFIIALQTAFDQTEECQSQDLIDFASRMTADSATIADDDGRRQIVSKREGVAIVGRDNVPNPVYLTPFRTFRDVDQPASHFIFRVRNTKVNGEPGIPQCALFPIEDASWRLAAQKNIADFLLQMKDSPAILI